MKVIRVAGKTAYPDYYYVSNEEAAKLCTGKWFDREVFNSEGELVANRVWEEPTHVYANKGALRHAINKMEKAARAKVYANKLANSKFVKPAGTKQKKRYFVAMLKEQRKRNPSPARREQLIREKINKKRKNRRK